MCVCLYVGLISVRMKVCVEVYPYECVYKYFYEQTHACVCIDIYVCGEVKLVI
jgi:hypothetical protein